VAFTDVVEQFLRGGQAWIAILAAIGLIALQIPGVDSLLEKLGIENSQHIRTLGSGILLLTIVLELHQLRASLEPAQGGPTHYSDPQKMYEALAERARTISDDDLRHLDVLGLTLYSAWPILSFMLQQPEMNSWSIRMATLAPDAEGVSGWVPEDWPRESAGNISQIQTFAGAEGKTRGQAFEVVEYDLIPAVHGFRLGNGDLFISILLWQSDGRLGKPGFTYDYIACTDVSEGAAASRKLFANWFDRALESHEEVQRRRTARGEPSEVGEPR